MMLSDGEEEGREKRKGKAESEVGYSMRYNILPQFS